MASTQAAPAWASIALDLLQSLEDAADLTVLGAGPATLSALPDALGGDPAQQADLTAGASSPVGFLDLLRGKAHYLMLPASVVADLRDADVAVQFSDIQQASPADSQDTPADLVTVQLGTAVPAYLAALGAALGRQPVPPDSVPLGAIYQQAALAWLGAVAPVRPDWPGILSAGTDAYSDTQVTGGATADPQQACLAAAGAYVAARTAAWYDALHALSNAITAQDTIDHDQLTSLLESARSHYEAVAGQQVFGAVDGSTIESPDLPDDLRQALDTHMLEGLPLTRSFDETPLRPLSDAILAGQVPSGQASEDDQLITDIAQNLVVQLGWGVDPDRDDLERTVKDALRSALEAQGTAGTYDPVAGAQVTPASLAKGVRAALGLADSDPVGWPQVLAVLREIFADQNPFSFIEVLERVADFPADMQPSWDAIDPDEAGADIEADAAKTMADVLYGSDDPVTYAFPAPVAAAAGVIERSELLKAAMKRSKKFFSSLLTPSTQQTGNVVERMIQADYVVQHPNNRVLMDFDVWDTAQATKWRALGGRPDEDLVRATLVSVTGDRYKPDICDLDSQEVFEIKPFRKVFLGLSQLYLRYLIPLNIRLFGYGVAKAMLESIDANGKYTANLTPATKPFLPGMDFKSPRWYPLPTGGWVFVILVAPGVIGYQVVSEVAKDAVEVETQEARKRIEELMAAMIAASVAALGARNVGGRPFTPDDLPPLAPVGSPGVASSADVLFAIFFLAIAALGGLILAPEIELPIMARIALPVLAAP